MEKMHWHFIVILATGWLYLVRPTTYTEGPLVKQYIGCFNLSIQSAAVASMNMTIRNCIDQCRNLNATFAVIQGGQYCSCVDAIITSLESNRCKVPCTGNQTQYCGGISSYSVYTVCPLGLYGFDCNFPCHCRDQIPCDMKTGACPNNRCEGNWTGAACNSNSVSDLYLGCIHYYDIDFDVRFSIENNSIATCSSICTGDTILPIIGLLSSVCYCFYGSYLYLFGPFRSDALCNYSCPGNPSQFCGGMSFISLFSVCPFGYNGENCLAKCNCRNDIRDIYTNPSGCVCYNGCKAGWIGNTCAIRDCSQNNGDCEFNQTCALFDLGYTAVNGCICSIGYQRSRLWSDCTDTDECLLADPLCNSSNSICYNTIGSYECHCKAGYMAISSRLCTDIDECADGIDVCNNITSNCSNIYGSYRCNCHSGYQNENDFICKVSESLRGGVIAGATVGAILGVALIASLIFFLCWSRRKQRSPRDLLLNISSLFRRTQRNPEEQSQSTRSGVEYSADPTTYETVNASTRESNETESVYTGLDASTLMTRLPSITDEGAVYDNASGEDRRTNDYT